MDPLEIEDTSDWLGCPTELETCTYYLRMLENEIQELNLQLRKAREDVFGLIQMHADAIAQRDEPWPACARDLESRRRSESNCTIWTFLRDSTSAKLIVFAEYWTAWSLSRKP